MKTFDELFNQDSFIFLDGGFGTMIQQSGAPATRVPELFNITDPQLIQGIHRKYIDAGADVIYTGTFGTSRYKLEGCGHTVAEVVKAAVQNAKEAAKGTDVRIAQDIGPIGKLMEPNGTMPFEEAYDMFKEQIIAGEGTDLIVIETMTDLYELRTALLAAKENSDRPVMCTMTFEQGGRTFSGTCIPSMAVTLEGLGASAIGINCSLGPKEFKPLIQELSQWTTLPIIAKPNAGLPDPETGTYSIGPEEFAGALAELIPYGVCMVGGCCGSDPEYIKTIRRIFRDREYCPQHPDIPMVVCTPERYVVVDSPKVVGERINPTGKKKLKAAIKEGDLDYVLDLAVKEVNEGAEILDVNAGVPGIDEKTVIKDIIRKLQGSIQQPLQIDSGNPEVLEQALRLYCGVPIINSVNGEEKSMAGVIPLAAKYGANLIGLTLDEDGIPKTVEKRIEIAQKITDRAIAAGVRRQNLIIDCLTLTVSAEQENAANTLAAIRVVKEKMNLKTTLGVSNISFGLPARPVINQNFLQMALTCGLDLAIINPAAPGMMEAFDVYRLINNIDKGAKYFIDKYKDMPAAAAPAAAPAAAAVQPAPAAAPGPDTDSLEYFINNGLENQCRSRIIEELKTREPLDIVNNELIPILDRTGKEFESGRIFIPQLIQAATTAQIGFEEIKKKLQENSDVSTSKGKVIMATVKGDVHDIGKNIVKVILDNYGYEIIDLGKDVAPELIVETAVAENVRLVGLSALMTTTLGSMVETIRLLHEKAPECRVMIGGAVVTADYAKTIGADYYVKDAMASAAAAKEVLG